MYEAIQRTTLPSFTADVLDYCGSSLGLGLTNNTMTWSHLLEVLHHASRVMYAENVRHLLSDPRIDSQATTGEGKLALDYAKERN
jgi:hypothetical protein